MSNAMEYKANMLSYKIDRFMRDYDYYEYVDQEYYDSKEEILNYLSDYNGVRFLKNYFKDLLEDTDYDEFKTRICNIIDDLNKYNDTFIVLLDN